MSDTMADLVKHARMAADADGCVRLHVSVLEAALAQRDAQPASLVSDREYLALFGAARAGSDKPSGTLRGVRACIAAYEAAQPVAQPAAQDAAVRVPLTLSQRQRLLTKAEAAMAGNPNLSWRDALITETEREHGITPTAAPVETDDKGQR